MRHPGIEELVQHSDRYAKQLIKVNYDEFKKPGPTNANA
jgi:hypothetical protein